MKGQKELLSNLKNVVNKPESSDVVFKCNDGVGVYASRWLLVNRCAVFSRMLSNGMPEARMSEVELVKFSSPTMLSIMEYLYTGTIEAYPPVTWKMGFELISAAQFFIIPQVEIIAQDFLRNQASSLDILFQKSVVADMLNVAIEFQEPWKGKDAMLQKLIHPIDHYWFEDCSHNLSRSALEYILSIRKRGGRQGKNEASVEEYYTFRKIVLWHVHQVFSMGDVEAKTAVQNALPGNALTIWRVSMIPTDIDDYLSDPSFSGDSTDGLSSLVGINICKDSLKKLSQHINLLRIPASLLVKVIHPLKIIPPRQLLKALVHQALHKPVTVQYPVSISDWKHGPSWTTCGQGQILCTGNDVEGTAIAAIPMPKSNGTGVYEWSFEIIENDACTIDLGIVCQVAGHAVGKDEILEKVAGYSSSSRVLRSGTKMLLGTIISRGPRSYKSQRTWEVFCDDALEVNSVVNFKLNVRERTCQVKFKETEAVWEDLPNGEIYPAVGVLKCNRARVQLRLLNGFDYF